VLYYIFSFGCLVLIVTSLILLYLKAGHAG